MESHPNKIVIYAFKNRELTEQDGEHPQFVLPVNPEQWAQKFKVEYDAKPAHGAQGVEGKFKSSAPEELRLDFVFDGTDSIYGYEYLGTSVPDQIQEFKSVVYTLTGEIHQPKFLKIIGLGISFDCFLTDLQITYVLFKPDGTPLRAKLSATFLNYKETERRVREERKSSPDLTHVRMVKAGDNLPLMTYRIYKDPKYYLEVAKANRLTNFRRLPAGQDILFPPFEKASS